MEANIFRFVYVHSRKQQLFITLLTLVSFPVLYYSLELPKTIINKAIQGSNFPQAVLGVEFDQFGYLLMLSLIFLLLVLINGAFKYYINVYKGRLGERILRRLRYQLYERMLHFPLHYFTRVPPGEIIPIITSEVEPLGGFVGECFATPVFQGGTLLTTLFFMAMQDPLLGLAAVALYPFQAYFIPRMQHRVNQLSKQRIRLVRTLSDQINETALGLEEIQTHATSKYQLAQFSARLAANYGIRFKIYTLKFLIKFLNNLIAQLTPFLFYSIGGYLVITQQLTAGALVAVLAAYKDLGAPWRELLDFYQQLEDARIKYQQVIEQFNPPGMRTDAEIAAAAETAIENTDELRLDSVTLADDDGYVNVDGISLTVEAGERIALVGGERSGKTELALALGGLLVPKSGRVLIGGRDLFAISRSVASRHIAYVGPNSRLFAASIYDNLVFGLRAVPASGAVAAAASAERRREMREAQLTGNSLDDPESDWIDYARAGVADRASLVARIFDLLEITELFDDLRELGLRGMLDPKSNPDFIAVVLEARAALRAHFADPALSAVFEPFDPARFNEKLSLGENLLFGQPVGLAFDLENLGDNDYVRKVLDDNRLGDRLVELGGEIARTISELFRDLPTGNELFRKFSFISAEELPALQAVFARVPRRGRLRLSGEDRRLLISLAFRMVPARHRLGLLDESLRQAIVAARDGFAAGLPKPLCGSIEFYRPENYIRNATLQDNLLFGRLAPGQNQIGSRTREIVVEVLEQAGLRKRVLEVLIDVGLAFQAGIGGARLSPAMQQKLALARALLKNPGILILNDAGSQLDPESYSRIIGRILTRSDCRTVVCVTHPSGPTHHFSRVVEIDSGRIGVADAPAGSGDELPQASAATV
jgi:ABC-type multidrug transport system fused ATPase/permease subunit